MARAILFVLALLSLAPARAQESAASGAAPRSFEIVRQDTEVEAAPDGQFWEFSDIRLRPLTAQGVQALQQRTLSYTYGYQYLEVEAYTLKSDGRKIDVPKDKILQGHGETTKPGFEDTRTMTIVYPNLEVGDQAVLQTRTAQNVPWFPGVFATIQTFPESVVVREARFAFTVRGNVSAYHITSSRVQAETPVSLGGKTRHVWRYRNDVPAKPEPGAVTDYAKLPRVEITSLADHAQTAKLYAEVFRDKAEVTPEIRALADKLTAGIKDRRGQAKALYEWVSANISYVNIVLGAGGFQPHKAADVLKNGYGDCKDHVMLLQALLAAKSIRSSSALILAGESQFQLASPSPFQFNHLINYIPEFKLYLDSTAQHAPFGVLPGSDAGRSVLIVETGTVDRTPPEAAASSSVRVETSITIKPDGSADGFSKIRATGTDAVDARGLMAGLPPDGDTEFFKALLGPGSDGKFTRGNVEDLSPEFEYSAKYRQGYVANFPGPGAISALTGFKPFSFISLISSDLPDTRTRDYVCVSGTYEEIITIKFPDGVAVTSLPAGRVFKTDGVELRSQYSQPAPDTVKTQMNLVLNRPGPVCRADGWSAARPALSEMINALRAQILYQ